MTKPSRFLIAIVITLESAQAANIITPDPINPGIAQRTAGALSDAEVSKLTKAAEQVGHSTGYYRNGCQSRAHVLWASLPDAYRNRVGKIWVFQPSSHSFFRKQGAIKTRLDSEVRWDFHVALSFQGPKGEEFVLDLALGSRPIPVQQWFSSFEIPDQSLSISSAGDLYSYYSTNSVATGFYKYEGDSLNGSWALEDAAFDTVGARLVSNPAECPSLSALASDAINAKAELESATFETKHSGPSCAALRDLYRAQCDRLEKLLPLWSRSAGTVRCGVQRPR